MINKSSITGLFWVVIVKFSATGEGHEGPNPVKRPAPT